MEGHFCFDEDFFEDDLYEPIKPDTTNVRFPEIKSEWFTIPTLATDGHDEATRLKFCGDWAFRRRQYAEAADFYRESLALVSDSNVTLKRALQESVTRCEAHLQLTQEAISGYRALRATSSNFEQTTVSLQLGAFVFRTLNLTSDLVHTLQQLLILHPADATVWLQMADVYSCVVKDSCLPHSDRLGLLLKCVAALHRTRFLLEQSLQNSNSFVKEKHGENLQKVIGQIESLDLSADVQTGISEHMRREQENEEYSGDDRYLLSLLPKSDEVFSSLWFPWLPDCLSKLSQSEDNISWNPCPLAGSVT